MSNNEAHSPPEEASAMSTEGEALPEGGSGTVVSRFKRPCPNTATQERNPRTGYCRRRRDLAPATTPSRRRPTQRKPRASTAANRRTVASLAVEVDALKARVDQVVHKVAPHGFGSVNSTDTATPYSSNNSIFGPGAGRRPTSSPGESVTRSELDDLLDSIPTPSRNYSVGGGKSRRRTTTRGGKRVAKKTHKNHRSSLQRSSVEYMA